MAATPPGGTRRSHGDSEIQASNYSKGAKGAEKGRSVENWARIWRTLVEGSPRPLHRWYFVIPERVSYKRLPHFQPLSSPLTERGGSEGLFFSTKVERTCNGARTQMNRSTPLRLLQLCRAYHGLFPSTTHRRTPYAGEAVHSSEMIFSGRQLDRLNDAPLPPHEPFDALLAVLDAGCIYRRCSPPSRAPRRSLSSPSPSPPLRFSSAYGPRPPSSPSQSP